ncbi:LuxR C-terminal-related transcriptional regulator [Microbacterium sp. NPDC087591]|uniref:helix-turn-helix transcriptional regulator n=1 Tax=Microbacterium sp. NPDC087591 TaxID=3364192 RepID=UPI0037FE2552
MLSEPVDARRRRRAFIVDELVMQRSRIDQLLTGVAGLDVVGVRDTFLDFLAWLRRTDKTQWPHLLVLGLTAHPWSARELSALAALREAGIRVLALTTSTSRTVGRRLAADGVEGFVSATDSEDDFVAAAAIVLSGGVIVTARAHDLLHASSSGTRLSTQEARVLSLYATGLTIAQVADTMGIRHDTARKYLNRVRNKFTSAGRPARSKLDLAQIAWADGYAEPAPRDRPVVGSR